MKPKAARTVPCPACKGPSVFGPENPYRPFCSARCKSLDLGAWASEQYRVGGRPGDAPDDEAPPPDDAPPH